MSDDVKTLIKAPIATVFRRAFVKRRDASTGVFESDWQDISTDVKSYGKIVNQIDTARRNKFTFGNAKLVMANEDGLYSPHDTPASLWYGYLNQQRTLVKIEAGFQKITQDANGIYAIGEFPSQAVWDESLWDNDATVWDASIPSTIFTGVISGDITLSDKNEVTLNIRPLTSVFQDFPARNLTGWTSTGMTASQFIGMLRDQTDGAGGFVFRPFFGDTTGNWDISTTSNVFANLNTATAEDVIDKTAWEIVEKLAEAENFAPYITRDGTFRFVSRDSFNTVNAFEFHGAGEYSGEFGHTIKTVDSYGFRISKYYSRVQIKWNAADTSTSYEVIEAPLEVSGASNPWVLGVRTLQIENLYIQTSTVANALAQAIYDDVSGLKKEIEFTTTFVPHLDLFDRFSIYYDPADVEPASLWDANTWPADLSDAPTDLILDSGESDALTLQGDEFKFLSFEIDLDNFQNKFVAREV
jgi:hypothetical protein